MQPQGVAAYDVGMETTATVVLTHTPETTRLVEIVDGLAEDIGESGQKVSYIISDTLPPGLPIGHQDQLSAQKRDSGPDAVYLVVVCED